MEKTKLYSPMILSFAAGILFFLAYRINPQTNFQEGFKLLLALLGALFALWAFVVGGDWLIARLAVHLQHIKEAWHAPQLEMVRYVSGMNRDQIRLYEQIGTFETISYLGNSGMRHVLYTPERNIPFTWIIDFLKQCEMFYPELIPQHGMPDTLQRDYVRSFTNLVVTQGLAERSIGNRRAHWNVTLEEVYRKLELVDA